MTYKLKCKDDNHRQSTLSAHCSLKMLEPISLSLHFFLFVSTFAFVTDASPFPGEGPGCCRYINLTMGGQSFYFTWKLVMNIYYGFELFSKFLPCRPTQSA